MSEPERPPGDDQPRQQASSSSAYPATPVPVHRYKRRRLGPTLIDSADSGMGYSAAHAFIGGTGAVGGAAVLRMISLYEEMFARRRPSPDQVPLLLATGRGEEDVSVFTRRLFRVAQSRFGDASRPTRVHSGYLTHSGIFVDLDRLRIALMPQLEDAEYLPVHEQEKAVAAAIAAIREQLGQPHASLGALLARYIAAARPFGTYLRDYAARHLADLPSPPFLSVTLGIPLPSVIAYHQDALRTISAVSGSLGLGEIHDLKDQFADTLARDLLEVRDALTGRLLIAHTTGVGGMYDEHRQGSERQTAVRLGFAHAAQDEVLAEKHHYANELASRYAAAGLLVLITAAAVGIDEVKVDERVPLHPKIVHRLFELPREVFPGSKQMMNPDSKAAKLAGRPIPARQYVGIHAPARVPLLSPPRSAELSFSTSGELRPRLAIRSGENGIFSVANAEALYRTMRVASVSELGTLLASVGLFGDDPDRPWFPDNICYYTESDNSRQVFDFLRLPQLMECQIGGLEPMALQNLGSSKHQGELHYLALLILYHRLRTLDVDAIDPYVDTAHFDPARFFIDNSRPLTFEDVDTWELGSAAHALASLAAARSWIDVLSLKAAPSRLGLFPQRDAALRALFDRILAAVCFSTCGLLAVLFRLRALYGLLREAVLELGTNPDFRWQMPRDERGHILVLPGACEAFRMFAEGLEKSTGLEHIDGVWGYGRAGDLERRPEVLGNLRRPAAPAP